MNDELNALWVKPGQRMLIANNFLEHQRVLLNVPLLKATQHLFLSSFGFLLEASDNSLHYVEWFCGCLFSKILCSSHSPEALFIDLLRGQNSFKNAKEEEDTNL